MKVERGLKKDAEITRKKKNIKRDSKGVEKGAVKKRNKREKMMKVEQG